MHTNDSRTPNPTIYCMLLPSQLQTIRQTTKHHTQLLLIRLALARINDEKALHGESTNGSKRISEISFQFRRHRRLKVLAKYQNETRHPVPVISLSNESKILLHLQQMRRTLLGVATEIQCEFLICSYQASL